MRATTCVILAVLAIGHSAFGQWELPDEPTVFPKLQPRLIVMSHASGSPLDVNHHWGTMPMAIFPDGTQFAVTGKVGPIPKAPKGWIETTVGTPATALRIISTRDAVRDGSDSVGGSFQPGRHKADSSHVLLDGLVRTSETSGNIGIYDSATGKSLAQLVDPDGSTFDFVLFSSDGSKLLTQDHRRAHTVLWDLSTRDIIGQYASDGDLAFSPDGACFLVHNGHIISRFSTTDGSLTSQINADKRMLDYQRGLAYTPDGKYFAVGYCIFDAKTGQLISGPPRRASSTKPSNWVNYYPAGNPLWFTPNGEKLISGWVEEYELNIYDIRGGTMRDYFRESEMKGTPLENSRLATDMGLFSGERILRQPSTASQDLALAVGASALKKPEIELLLYDLQTGNLMAELLGPDKEGSDVPIACVVISNDNRMVVAARRDGATLLWDIGSVATPKTD